MTISVDADAQMMRWSFNGQQFAETVITNYLKQKSFVAFVSMHHEKDVVNFRVKGVMAA